MIYKLKYTIPFNTINDVSCVVELHQKNYLGNTIELKAGSTPFKIDVETVDLNIPIRAAGATLEVFGSDYLQDLYASSPFEVRVMYKVNGAVKWVGYITQDTFSQDYSNPEFIYEIECASALSVLKYKKMDVSALKLSLLDIIKSAIYYAGYERAYLTDTVRTKSREGHNLYYTFKLASANFIDELGEVNTYYEALEEIATYLTCTFTPYNDSLMLINYEGIKKGENNYYKIDDSPISLVELKDVTTVQQLGYRGTGATISRIAGYSKASVNCSLYELDTDVMHKIGKEGMQFSHSARYTATKDKNRITAVESIYDNVDNEGFELFMYPNPGGLAIGATYVDYSEFPTDDPPVELSPTPLVVVDRGAANTESLKDKRIIKLYSKGTTITSGEEYFVLTFDYRTTLLTKYDLADKEGATYTAHGSIIVKAILKYGDLYYNGAGWQSSEVKFDLEIEHEKDTKYNEWISVRNENNYDTNIGGYKGRLIRAPKGVKIGSIELTLHSSNKITAIRWEHFKNIELNISIPEKKVIFGDYVTKDSKNDLIYEKEIAGDFAEEADEINLNICTKPDGKIGLSCVFTDDEFVDVYKHLGQDIQPEHNILNKQVNLFSKSRLVINPSLKNDLKPFSLVTDSNLDGVTFLYGGGVEDAKMESEMVNLIEL